MRQASIGLARSNNSVRNGRTKTTLPKGHTQKSDTVISLDSKNLSSLERKIRVFSASFINLLQEVHASRPDIAAMVTGVPSEVLNEISTLSPTQIHNLVDNGALVCTSRILSPAIWRNLKESKFCRADVLHAMRVKDI